MSDKEIESGLKDAIFGEENKKKAMDPKNSSGIDRIKSVQESGDYKNAYIFQKSDTKEKNTSNSTGIKDLFTSDDGGKKASKKDSGLKKIFGISKGDSSKDDKVSISLGDSTEELKSGEDNSQNIEGIFAKEKTDASSISAFDEIRNSENETEEVVLDGSLQSLSKKYFGEKAKKEVKELENIPEREFAGKGPIRVLHVFGKLGLGGAESRVMDIYRNIDRTKIQFDFLVHVEAGSTGKSAPTSDELLRIRGMEYFDAEITRLGGRIFAVPRFQGNNLFAYKKAMTNFFNEYKGRWKIVQGHMTSTAAIYLPIAKAAGVEMTISHVRSAGVDSGIKGIVTDFLRSPFKKKGTADYYFACSSEAGRRVYGDALVDSGDVKIIPNAVNINKFLYDPVVRQKIRESLGINNAIVIGHVGRFHEAKNHEFIIKVFAKMVEMIRNDSANRYLILHGLPLRLMLLGEGPLMGDIKQLVHVLGMDTRVLFMNNRSNVNEYYQAMDYFLFPSKYEGLPGTVIEAQAAGLQCLISDTITTEVDQTSLVSRMSLEEDEGAWAKKILDDLVPEQILMMDGIKDEDKKHIMSYEQIHELLSNGKEKQRINSNDLPVGRYLDRVETSDTISHILKKGGFDVKNQALTMAYFYQKGYFPG